MYQNLMRQAIACLVLWIPLTSALAADAGSASTRVVAPPLQVGFLYVAPLTPMGWVGQHDLGRQAIEREFNRPGQPLQVSTRYIENLPEGPDAERVMRQWISEGVRLIFAPSFGYMEPVMRVAQDHPEVRFESITGYQRAANVATANARYYQGRYLAGVAAGMVSQTGTAGYVAGFPIPEVLQGINAFALGMQSVNPKARVKVIWLEAWFDPPRERDAAMALIHDGADVLAFHTGSTAVMVAAQEKGVWGVAYHSDMRSIAPDAQLLSVQHNWQAYDVSRVKALLQGQWRSHDVWGGLREDMIRVGDFGRKVAPRVRERIQALSRQLAKGQPVFIGPVRDQQGRLRLVAGQRASDEQILNMNYLVMGVTGRAP